MIRLWVTGGTGFIGRAVLMSLARCGCCEEILVTSRSHCAHADMAGIPCYEVDLFDTVATHNFINAHRPTHLLHLAWDVTHGQFWTSPANLDWVSATLSLAKIFRQSGGVRMVGVGTCAEYDWHTRRPLLETSQSEGPSTLYGTAKLATKDVLASYASISELSFAWARMFFLFGPGESAERLVAGTIISCLEQRRLLCSDGAQLRDFLGVSDAADALVAILFSDARGAINIGSGKPMMIRDLVLQINQLTGGSGDIVFGGRARAPNDPDVIVPDLSRLFNEVGWSPGATLEARLIQTIDWWRSAHIM